MKNDRTGSVETQQCFAWNDVTVSGGTEYCNNQHSMLAIELTRWDGIIFWCWKISTLDILSLRNNHLCTWYFFINNHKKRVNSQSQLLGKFKNTTVIITTSIKLNYWTFALLLPSRLYGTSNLIHRQITVIDPIFIFFQPDIYCKYSSK